VSPSHLLVEDFRFVEETNSLLPKLALAETLSLVLDTGEACDEHAFCFDVTVVLDEFDVFRAGHELDAILQVETVGRVCDFLAFFEEF